MHFTKLILVLVDYTDFMFLSTKIRPKFKRIIQLNFNLNSILVQRLRLNLKYLVKVNTVSKF